MRLVPGGLILATALLRMAVAVAADPTPFLVCVSNERSGDVTVLRRREGRWRRSPWARGPAGSTPAPTADRSTSP